MYNSLCFYIHNSHLGIQESKTFARLCYRHYKKMNMQHSTGLNYERNIYLFVLISAHFLKSCLMM
jgi:hypothetical protein